MCGRTQSHLHPGLTGLDLHKPAKLPARGSGRVKPLRREEGRSLPCCALPWANSVPGSPLGLGLPRSSPFSRLPSGPCALASRSVAFSFLQQLQPELSAQSFNFLHLMNPEELPPEPCKVLSLRNTDKPQGLPALSSGSSLSMEGTDRYAERPDYSDRRHERSGSSARRGGGVLALKRNSEKREEG